MNSGIKRIIHLGLRHKCVGEVVDMLRKDLKISVDDAEMFYRIGEVLYERGEIPKAIHYLNRALVIAPQRDDYALLLGMAYEAIGEEIAAFCAYRKAARSSYEEAFVQSRLAYLSMKKSLRGERLLSN